MRQLLLVLPAVEVPGQSVQLSVRLGELISAYTVKENGTDINTLTKPGKYYISSNAINAPDGMSNKTYIYIDVISAGGTSWIQVVRSLNKPEEVYTRSKLGGIISNWVRI